MDEMVLCTIKFLKSFLIFQVCHCQLSKWEWYLCAGMSVFRLTSDFRLFLSREGTGIKLIKFGQNRDKSSRIPKDRLDSGKGHDTTSLITVSKH